jgi:acyl carrier protein
MLTKREAGLPHSQPFPPPLVERITHGLDEKRRESCWTCWKTLMVHREQVADTTTSGARSTAAFQRSLNMGQTDDRRAVFEKVATAVAAVLSVPVERIGEDSSFTADLVVDSLLMYEIVIDLEELFDTRISDSAIDRIETISDVVDFIMVHKD